MSEFPSSERLLKHVAWRLYFAKLAWRVFLCFIGVAITYGVALLVARLTGLIPDVFSPQTLWAIPGAAVVLGLALTRFPNMAEAARQADAGQGTKDLFLTLTMLDRCAGDYKPLVGRDAEERARKSRADKIVPYAWERPSLLGGLVMPAVVGLLALGIFFLPALDPFGAQAQAREQEDLAERIAQTRKENEIRRNELARHKDVENENSEDVEQAIEKLKADFQQMRQPQRKENAQKLAINQKTLGDKWRKLNAEQLSNKLNSSELDGKFGGRGAEQMRQWERELQEGSTEGLQDDIEELANDLERLAQTEDSDERQELMRKIEKQIDDMSEFASDKAGSQELAAALQRASEQLQAMQNSKSENLSQEALQALQESMNLAQMEAKELSQTVRDMQSLEEAMRLISMAKELNSEEMLDGEACEDCQSLSDYAELYEQMMAARGGRGDGEGTGGEGMGEGGEVPEDDSVETDFVSERSKSAIQKGKVLLSMKTKGLSDSGEARKEYRQALEDVKQGVSEAIDQEQIPPGYTDAIQKYFDNIDRVEPALQAEEN